LDDDITDALIHPVDHRGIDLHPARLIIFV